MGLPCRAPDGSVRPCVCITSSDRLRRQEGPMRPPFPLSACLSPLALVMAVLATSFLLDPSAQAQSSQPPLPAQSLRPDQTKPLEDKPAQQQHEPTAAEISRNETVASALLRGLH